jgi:dTDP-4-dehydrorhamnose reductase
MRVLILGGSGMLGHQLWRVLASNYETHGTVRRGRNACPGGHGIETSRCWPNVLVEDFGSVIRAVKGIRPDVVVNCIGIIKQTAAARDPIPSITVNALFPHRLAELCAVAGSRLIHISTDCVFSGSQGNYCESDVPDPQDLYGQTKLLGEVSGDHCLTLRTSMIGRELESSFGLLEWFLRQQGKQARGYTRAIFSGFTTNVLAEIVTRLIADHPQLSGLWHVASQPITKFELLALVNRVFRLDVELVPDETIVCDRSLNAERFMQATGYRPPTWPAMVEQLLA